MGNEMLGFFYHDIYIFNYLKLLFLLTYIMVHLECPKMSQTCFFSLKKKKQFM